MRRLAAAVLSLIVLGATAAVAGAGSKDVDFKKVFKAGDLTYRVRSTRIANAPSLERVKVEVIKFGKTIAQTAIEQSDPVTGAWMANLDAVGEPELVVTTASAGGGQAGSLSVFELRGDALSRAELPRMSAGLLKGYLGRDRFSVEDGLIVRRFPRFVPGDPDCCPTGGEVELHYVYRDGRILEVEPASPSAEAKSGDKPPPRE